MGDTVVYIPRELRKLLPGRHVYPCSATYRMALMTCTSKPFYSTESLGGTEYFTAVYADVAVSPACVTCHNAHKDSPRNNFESGETMGCGVIRIPLKD